MLNLLNTSVLANQSSYCSVCSQSAVNACDRVVLMIKMINTSPITYTWDYTKLTAPGDGILGPSQFWKATFTVTTSIKSSLIISRDDCVVCKARLSTWTSTFGTDSNVTLNPVFMPVRSMNDGGWYISPNSMTGTIFGLYSTAETFDPVEIMLYSQEAIQINALSAVATNPFNQYPAANALQKIVVLLVTASTNTCVIAGFSATELAKVEIDLKAFGQIKGVVLQPGYALEETAWKYWQTTVAISVNKVGNTKHLCGVMANYYTQYSEVSCNQVGNQIIFEQQTAGQQVRFCGVGVFSNCNCASSTFESTYFTTAPTGTLVSANSLKKFFGDTTTFTATVSRTIPDTVSTLCGNGDGITKCGLRTIKFYDSSSAEIFVWPYLGIIWDSITSKISLPGTYQTLGNFTIDVEISLTSNPTVKQRQTITVAVLSVAPTTPAAPTTAISGTDVAITWVAPANGGSVVTEYTVQIKQSDGLTYSTYAGCTGTAINCTVPISVCQAAPFNLVTGSSVYAKVFATNAFGSSAYSEGNGAVLRAPSAPAIPATSISGTKVLVTWAADGGSGITGYKVAIRQSDGSTFTTLASCYGPKISCSIPITVLKAAPYNLTEGESIYASVIATNLFGSSSASMPGNGAVIVKEKLPMSLPFMNLNAVIGKEASLLLPELTGVSYIVLGKPRYQVSVNGLLLKVKSDSDSDIGSHQLQINAITSGQSGNITVNVIFSNVTTTAQTAISNTENLVLSVEESDSLLETTTSCNTTEAGILSCVTDIEHYYSIDPNKTTNAAQSEVLPERPTISVSRVNPRGSFFIKFSQAMNILSLKNTTNDKQLQVMNSTTQNETLDKYMYLLSPKHLRIEVKSENTTRVKVSWFAKNITSTKIEMQLVFEDPLSISNDRSSRDMLVFTVLPPALRYFKTLASGALTKNPLQTITLRLPPQSIPGTVLDSVSKVAKIMEESGQYTALANLAIQLAVSGSMAKMWSMVNAFQIVNSFNYLSTNTPGNVKQVMKNLNDMLQLSALETDQITSSIFNFTETQSPGAGFTEMGNESKVLTAFIGNLFYIGVLILLVYLLYGFVHGCGYSDRRCKRFDLWLLPKLIWSALICYQQETSLDFGIGTLLKFEEPNSNTTGDIFDLGLSISAVICLLLLPLTQVICLCKKKGQIDDRKFKQKWGSLYSELKTFTPGQRETAIKMFFWFLFRRILTALNLVELRNQTIWLQLTLNMWLCLADACLIFHWSPYENTTRDIMEKFNGAVVLLLSQLVWMQTDLIPSPVDRYLIGWYYLGFLAIMFLANILVVVISALKYPTDGFKRSLLKRKQEKALAKKQAQRNYMLACKQSKEAQKNGLPPGTVVDEPPILSERTLLVFKIKALKRKPIVDQAKVKQLEKKLVALDKKLAGKQFKDGALIDAKIQRFARSRTSTNGKVGAQQSKQIGNRPSKVKLSELLERQAAEAKPKEFEYQRQTELEIQKIKQLKEEEQAKISEEERQRRISKVNSQWIGCLAHKNQQKMEEDVILQFEREQKIQELKRSDALYQQKNAVRFVQNMLLNSKMQDIQQKREEDAILQFAREQKREELKRSDPRPENEQVPSKIIQRRQYYEEDKRRYLRILNKLQNKEQVLEQEMSVIDLEQQNPRPQLQRGTDAEFSFRAYK